MYGFLAKYKLNAAGGRLDPVGLPCLLLVGGFNFYGDQVGFGCDRVSNFEVVLANGFVVHADKKANSDLSWALKGSSSNFGVVASFDMETLPSRQVWAALIPSPLNISMSSLRCVFLIRFV